MRVGLTFYAVAVAVAVAVGLNKLDRPGGLHGASRLDRLVWLLVWTDLVDC